MTFCYNNFHCYLIDNGMKLVNTETYGDKTKDKK